MRTCPKCGRANQPTRKYCIRCGGNLLSVEQKPKTISSPTVTPVTPEPDVKVVQPPATTPSEAKVTTNDEWVKPSQVSPDRVRTGDGTSKPKSEMEKAKEIFAKADSASIEDTEGDIIEPRMLRASEVQELMGEMESQPSVSAAPPSASPQTAATPPPTVSHIPPAASSPPAAPPGTKPAKPEPSVPTAPAPKVETAPTPAAPRIPDIPRKAPSTTAPPSEPAVKATPSSLSDIETILSTLPDRAYRQDPMIQGIVNDLTNLHTELAQFNSDLDNVRTRLESEVREYWNLAEVKRIHFESVEEQLRLAKREWNDTTKVYQQAAKRMSNELSSREKRIKDIEKRIKKTEGNIGKRAKELDKYKEKEAQSQ